MLSRLSFLLLCALVSALAAPVAASAKPSVGISDNHPAMLADPLFEELGAKRVRLVVSYNAIGAAARGDNEISDKVAPYIAAADAQGVDVHVAFEHARGDAQECDSGGRGAQCKLPSVGAYKRQVTRFLERFPSIDSITAWNEANHNTQPTYKNPKRAGQFAKAADAACRKVGRRCTVVAMDILDAADNPKATRKLDYGRTKRFIKKLRRAYGRKPAVCGIHNYADVNRFRTSGTKALTRAMRCRSYWLTETGGFYNFASFWSKATKRVGRCKTASSCQVKAMKYLFSKTVRAARRITRVYVYNFYSGEDGRFDAGIVKGDGDTPTGKRRKAFKIVARQL